MKIDKDFVVRIGGNDYAETPNLLACNGEPLLRVKRDDHDGRLDVQLDIYDERGRERAVIRRARLVKGDPDAFEIRDTDSRYKVVDRKHQRVVCEIRRRANARDMDIDVSLLMHTPDGFLVHANPAQTNLRVKSSEEIVRGRDAALKIG